MNKLSIDFTFNFWFWIVCKDLVEKSGNCCMLFRIVVHLGVLGEWLLLRVRIMRRVSRQMYRDFPEMKYV